MASVGLPGAGQTGTALSGCLFSLVIIINEKLHGHYWEDSDQLRSCGRIDSVDLTKQLSWYV